MDQLDVAGRRQGLDINLGVPGTMAEMSDTSATSKTGGVGALTERYLGDNPNAPGDQPAWALARGGVKSLAQVGSTALNLANKVVPSERIKAAADWLHQGSQPEGFWENAGALGEQLSEFLTGNALFKLAGPAIESTATGARVVNAVKQAKGAQQVGEVLAAHPRLAGIVAQGLMQGAQTYAHTGDPMQAAAAGVLGGGMQAGAEGVAAGGRHLVDISPKSITLAGEEVPTLAAQVKGGHAVEGGAVGAPKIAEQQQQGATNVIKNLAQQATAQAIDQINRTRPMFTAVEDPSRLLTAGEPRPQATAYAYTPTGERVTIGAGPAAQTPQAPAYAYSPSGVMSKGAAPPQSSEPFTFTLEAPGTHETPTGEIGQSAAKVPRPAAFEPQYTTASAPTRQPIRPGMEPGYRPGVGTAEGATGADVSTARPPAAAGETVGGGGNLTTTSPAEAQSWLRQLEEIQASPMHDQLTAAQQAGIETQRKALQDQLGLYHSSPYAQRFVAENPLDAMEHVRHFGDAADQIEATAQPVFQTLDRASGGEFAKFRDAAKQAQKVMGSAQTLEAREAAAERFTEANNKINDLIDRHSDAVSRTDYVAAKNAWRQASRLNELHGNLESMTNGITTDESDNGLNRVMTGRAKSLENYLNKGTNRAQIEQMIGKEGVENLKDLTLLLSKANTARSTVDVLKNVFNQMHGYTGMGAYFGGQIAELFGIPHPVGALGGAVSIEGTRWVLRNAATSPQIGRAISYAARNGIRPQVYAPLIARMIAVPFQEQQEQQPEEQPAGAQK
jgi:hypothetical protein